MIPPQRHVARAVWIHGSPNLCQLILGDLPHPRQVRFEAVERDPQGPATSFFPPSAALGRPAVRGQRPETRPSAGSCGAPRRRPCSLRAASGRARPGNISAATSALRNAARAPEPQHTNAMHRVPGQRCPCCHGAPATHRAVWRPVDFTQIVARSSILIHVHNLRPC